MYNYKYFKMKKNRQKEGDNILSNLFSDGSHYQYLTLRTRFEIKLMQSGITETTAIKLLDTNSRTLNGILDGTQKRIDFTLLSKLAHFLEISNQEVVKTYVDQLELNFNEDVDETKKRKFIQNNFDIKSLHKVGFIDNTTDYNHIEERLLTYFGFDEIYEYRKDIINAALSSGKPKPNDTLNRDLWIESAANILKRINNYYDYDRDKLLDFFPQIRWYSMNLEKGLFQVVRELFKLGVTVIFEKYLPKMYVRGATFSVHGKPCIVLTNYTNYYPTFWFTLIHELHHVLYDWEEIKINSYQISGELDLFTINEVEADEFAREYLLPKENIEDINPHIGNKKFINKYAKQNFIHPSMIYLFYTYDHKDLDKRVWTKYMKEMPDVTPTLESLCANPWQKRKPIKEVVKEINSKLFNNL